MNDWPRTYGAIARAGTETPSLWGGLECTIVRVGDTYRNQFEETGHQDRIEDLDAIASLGIKTLRYPILWEAVAPEHPELNDWAWHDRRLGRLRELGITPIIGLIHHGSGPYYTSLTDEGFAEGLAKHAANVIRRYPWLTMFTPVNEPVTTARFSGLYGHWYPHLHDEASFYRMVINQVRAVILSMRAIRQVAPHAALIQTEDIGKAFATDLVQYQADYENERRWLSLDLLCGRVDSNHPLWGTLLSHGLSEADLAFFTNDPMPPDIIGVNHYLTSERYLDHSWWDYPTEFYGGNGVTEYADVEAVRVAHLQGEVGPAARLREVWSRYQLPLAITEAHHGLTEDVQCRWLLDVWRAGCELKHEGVDIRAVTIWSLFGVVDWNSLLLQRNGFYEPGAFDARDYPPKRTALADVAQQLATLGFSHGHKAALLGWWQRPERFYATPASAKETVDISDMRPTLKVLQKL